MTSKGYMLEAGDFFRVSLSSNGPFRGEYYFILKRILRNDQDCIEVFLLKQKQKLVWELKYCLDDERIGSWQIQK